MTKINKLDRLLKTGQKLYHTQDLALLWQIANRNTLYTAIKRLVKKQILVSVRKGLYSVLPLDQLDPYRLGAALIHHYSYVSGETVLAQAGIISQKVYPITFVSSVPAKIKINDQVFLFRKLKEKYLINPTGISLVKGVLTAGPERAVADTLYFNPRYYFDNPALIDQRKVKQIQRQIGY
ncbi:hypothetical protein COX09_03555 [Candidatus Beckwithbacteria bacterium CG23_combo_of_CG06-09_8_20_14_all_47_9]|uniref:AbiEi antitoxin C-terminal domain-containing protein n=1 Tax=Candidatus Beckwithbacteria bacterium CG23_combo_of_CG06-09_8_20_14_all_47_9 TaxID=1974498 RepID=A0A2H0B379_9BACT|nr:MAG: hypothetical protein COX09_03555 [Candidatus Beckwithbacteria bacterium CG23_combo_of_CG06-09_8_20_14_all_47_9]